MSVTTSQLSLSVNGETVTIAPGDRLADMLARLGLDARKIAVERNREIVPRSTYGLVCLADGDVLEIVNFVGGG